MHLRVIKEGDVLRLLSSSEEIPEGKVLRLFALSDEPETSPESNPLQASCEFEYLGLHSFFATQDDANINWEDCFESQR